MDYQTLQDIVLTFTSIVWEAFPFVVLGALLAGILEEMVPQQWLAKLVPKKTVLAVSLGGLLGLVFPMCECGIVPVMRRLLRKGLPLGTCIAYMLAGPIINVVVITSTYIAFEKHGTAPVIVGFRIGMGFVTAVTTGYIVQLLYRKHGNTLLTELTAPQTNPTHAQGSGMVHPAEKRAGEKKPWMVRLGNITETTLHDFIDIMVFLTLGSLLAAICKQMLSPAQVAQLSSQHPALAILTMMGLAIALCLCSEADAFVAATFTTLETSAKLAFLVLGPMFDLKLLLMFTRVFRRRLILVIIVSVITQVFVYTMLFHYLGETGLFPKSSGSPSVKTTQE